MRPGDDSSSEFRRLERILATVPDQRAADEDDLREISVSGVSASPRERRATRKPGNCPAMASPRRAWRGTMIVSGCRPRLASLRCTSASIASSPLCVLAATSTGRLATACRSRASSPASNGSGGVSYFRLPMPVTRGRPRAVKRSASCMLCAKQRVKPASSLRMKPGKSCQRLYDRSDMRALTMPITAPVLRVSTIRFGQNSESTHSATSGCQWLRNARTGASVSTGTNWWSARFGRRFSISAADVTVTVVSRICRSGNCPSRCSISGTTAFASPTLAACIQTSMPRGRW